MIQNQGAWEPGYIRLSGFSDEAADSFKEQLDCMEELGLRYIELRNADGVSCGDFTPQQRKNIREMLQERGIQVSSIGSPIGKIEVGEPLEPHFECFRRVVELAQELQTPYIRMFSFFIPREKDPEDYRNFVLENLFRMKEYAEKENVILLHENEKDIYGDTSDRCRFLMEKLYGPHFQAVFDFANFIQCKQDTWEAYEKMKPYIAYVHIKDALMENGKVVPPGAGDGQLRKILGALKEEGYSGFFSMEPHLSNFSALQYLEQNAQKRVTEMNEKEAWELALGCFRDILKELSWEVQP